MLSKDEFYDELYDLLWVRSMDSPEAEKLLAHDHEQRAEIERLRAEKFEVQGDLAAQLERANQWQAEAYSLKARLAKDAMLFSQREELKRLRDSQRVRDARYIGAIEALLHGVDEYWEEHDGRETVLDAIRLVEESKK